MPRVKVGLSVPEWSLLIADKKTRAYSRGIFLFANNVVNDSRLRIGNCLKRARRLPQDAAHSTRHYGGRRVGVIQGSNHGPNMTDTERQGLVNDQAVPTRPLGDKIRGLWEAMRDYFGSHRRRRRDEPVNDRASLRHFLETRASYVAQTSLYGYLRTRAGMTYPRLFDDDVFVRSVNIAKWHIWLACLSDLSVYAGGLLAQHAPTKTSEVGALMDTLVTAILHDAGTPADADNEFSAHAERVRARLAACAWAQVTDDEAAFSASPTALLRWAPIVDSLKELDEEIVRNSVRFRWQEIRRYLRRNLDAAAVMRAAS